MTYINKILSEVDEAVAGLYDFASKPENYNMELITLVLNQIEAIKRFKMHLEASGLFKHKEYLNHETINKVLKELEINESNGTV